MGDLFNNNEQNLDENNVDNIQSTEDNSIENSTQVQQNVQYNQPVQSTPIVNNMPYNNGYQQKYQQPFVPQKPKNKIKVTAIVFICLLVICFTFFLGGYIIRSIYLKNGPEKLPLVPPTTSSQPNTTSSTPSSNPTTPQKPIVENKNAPKLILNDIDSSMQTISSVDVAKKVRPSVVGVICYDFKDGVESKIGEGSGIVMTKDGYIITNSHVIGDSNTHKVRIIDINGNTYNGEIVGFDTRTDLAVVKTDANNLVPAEFYDSDKIQVGEKVYAIGNPGGMEYASSITDGIVSAVGRVVTGLSNSLKLIQTNAAINPGNSGGALVNEYGQVIGIVSAKLVATSYEGMGFVIPITQAKDVIDQICRYTRVTNRPLIGISGTAVTQDMATYFNCPTGVKLVTISEKSSLANTEIQVDDIITYFDGEKVSSINDIYAVLDKYEIGDSVKIKIYHFTDKNKTTGKEIEMTITLYGE